MISIGSRGEWRGVEDEKFSIQAAPFHVYVVYRHPRDFPGYYVVRPWLVIPGDGVYQQRTVQLPGPRFTLTVTLEDARRLVPAGSARVDRFLDDDPAIAEVWF